MTRTRNTVQLLLFAASLTGYGWFLTSLAHPDATVVLKPNISGNSNDAWIDQGSAPRISTVKAPESGGRF